MPPQHLQGSGGRQANPATQANRQFCPDSPGQRGQILEVLAQGYLNPMLGQFGQNFHEVFPYLLMVLVLVVRPYGLFGQKTVRRV